MAEESFVSRAMIASAPPLPQTAGTTLHWNGSSGVCGEMASRTLRRVITYIQDHLEQGLSLATLAAVAQTSPAHFARLFKQATGWTLYQYVTTCRMESAKRLLAETDMPLSEIAPEVGCADQSHFTALFRKHASMIPQVYRNTTWR